MIRNCSAGSYWRAVNFSRVWIFISKGQGNFETLSDVKAPLYFLLTVKCPVVAAHLSGIAGFEPGRITGNGELVVMKNRIVSSDELS